MLLTETCYYSFLQQSIKWVHFQSLLITTSFTIACVLFLQFSSQNGVKSFRAFLFMIYLIIILGDPFGSPEFCIFISKDWEKSDRNSWGSYILDDFGIISDLLDWIKYGVATNQDVLLFKLLTFLGVLLTETCYCSRLYGMSFN